MPGMRTATVRMVLREKIDSWLKSFESESLINVIKNNVIITGGAINSLLMGEKPNDYDVYFKTREAARQVAEYYVSMFNYNNTLKAVNNYLAVVRDEVQKNIKGEEENRIVIFMQSAGVASERQVDNNANYNYFENGADSDVEKFFDDLVKTPIETAFELNRDILNKEPYRPVFLTDNAITLSNKLQVIIRFHGTMYDIHRNFDFVHAMGCYDYLIDHLEVSGEIYESILSKNLIYKGSLYPVASLFRLRKFLGRGWRITAGQMLKIASQISEIDLSDPKVLKEQLIGVDYAYMRQLIQMLQSRDSGTRVDSIYLARLIDEIFE